MIHPDCMMPDGAQPCLGFRELDAETDRMRATLGWFLDSVDCALGVLEDSIEQGDRASHHSALLQLAGYVEQIKTELKRGRP